MVAGFAVSGIIKGIQIAAAGDRNAPDISCENRIVRDEKMPFIDNHMRTARVSHSGADGFAITRKEANIGAVNCDTLGR